MGSNHKKVRLKHHRRAIKIAKEFAKAHGLKVEIPKKGRGAHMKIRLYNDVDETTIPVATTPNSDNTDRGTHKNLRQVLRRLETDSNRLALVKT